MTSGSRTVVDRTVVVRPYRSRADAAWAEAFLDDHLGGRWQARRGELHDVLEPGLGFIAEVDAGAAGLLTWRPEAAADAVELSAMAAMPPRHGIGGTLLEALVGAVRSAGRSRIRVVTTNDNLEALRFYQRRGFVLVELRAGAVDEARRTIKPAIGRFGASGIPLRDELELELILRTGP